VGHGKKHTKKHKAGSEPTTSPAMPIESEATVYGALLHDVGPVLGPLGQALARANERRGEHLLYLLGEFRPLVTALSQLQQAFLWLAGQRGVDADVAAVVRSCADHLVSGTDRLLSEEAPRQMDASRFLLEVEFLFRDFARDPGQHRAWRETTPQERDATFGFRALRARAEQEQHVPDGKLLFEEHEYRTHGARTHPRATATHPEPPAPDTRTGLFYDAADLLHHAMRVWALSETTVRLTGSVDDAAMRADPPSLDAVVTARELVERVQRERVSPS
jgi:hypothetical protein